MGDTNMDEAAAKIQSLYRCRKSRKLFNLLFKASIEKVFDEWVVIRCLLCNSFSSETGCFFYYNIMTGTSSWEKPVLLGKDEALTPRARAKLRLKVQKRLEGREKKAENFTADEAALSIQGLFRTLHSKKMLRKVCKRIYEKVYDPATGLYFYYNSRTEESSWFKPLIMVRGCLLTRNIMWFVGRRRCFDKRWASGCRRSKIKDSKLRGRP